jgi:hypothetical protein
MKACWKNRQLIAWLALDALDAARAPALCEHLAHCEGCRRYWEEMSRVAQGLASAARDSHLEASEVFHHKVAERLQAVQSGSVREKLAQWLGGWRLNWQAALPAMAVLGIALFAMIAPRHHRAVSLPAQATVQVVSSASSASDLAPTLANYQIVADQSLEKLSELLTRQGNKRLPSAPLYTASSLELANASF